MRDTDRLGNRVGGLDADPPHVGRQPARFVADHTDGVVAVLLEDPHR